MVATIDLSYLSNSFVLDVIANCYHITSCIGRLVIHSTHWYFSQNHQKDRVAATENYQFDYFGKNRLRDCFDCDQLQNCLQTNCCSDSASCWFVTIEEAVSDELATTNDYSNYQKDWKDY